MRAWLKKHRSARIVLAVIMFLTFPIWWPVCIAAFILGVILGGAYKAITQWANNV